MGSSDWLRVYPFEEHVLLLHGAWCQQPAVQLSATYAHHPFSDEWRARWGCELTVTGNSVWRRWTAGPDKHSIAVSKTTQQVSSNGNGRAGVLWASRSDSTANVQHSWSWGALSSGPAAGSRINQRQVARYYSLDYCAAGVGHIRHSAPTATMEYSVLHWRDSFKSKYRPCSVRELGWPNRLYLLQSVPTGTL
jgi:hypothetical protein